MRMSMSIRTMINFLIGGKYSMDLIPTDDGTTDPDQGAAGDPDNDLLLNFDEVTYQTDPKNSDSDGDGLPDGWEIQNGLDPNDDGTTDPDQGATGDPDQDTLVNSIELQAGTNPFDADTDDDYVGDGPEVSSGGGALALSASQNPVLNVIGVYQALEEDPSGSTIIVVFERGNRCQSSNSYCKTTLAMEFQSNPTRSHMCIMQTWMMILIWIW